MSVGSEHVGDEDDKIPIKKHKVDSANEVSMADSANEVFIGSEELCDEDAEIPIKKHKIDSQVRTASFWRQLYSLTHSLTTSINSSHTHSRPPQGRRKSSRCHDQDAAMRQS